MSSHELARRLLDMPDLPAFTSYDDSEFDGEDSWIPIKEEGVYIAEFCGERRVYVS